MSFTMSLKEEFLTCALCNEVYTDPCTLGCQHSFCRKCVTDYIKTRPDAVRAKTIPCAFCKQNTWVSNPTRPVDEWAAQFKPSLMLQGLMDRHQSGHKHAEGQDVCFLCKAIGKTTPASSWCSDCEVTLCSRCSKMHLQGPATKKHELLDLSGGAKMKQRRKVKCSEHEGEQIKFICKDCNTAACQTCCTIKHRACKDVVTIGSMIPEIKSALTEKRRSLSEKIQKNMATVEEEESKIEQLKNKETNTGSEIKSTVENAISLLMKKETNLLMGLEDETNKYVAPHQANIQSIHITTQVYQQHHEFIDQALQSESEMEMYDVYQVCQSGALESKTDTELDTRKTPFVGEMKFKPNMEPLRRAISEIGKVEFTEPSFVGQSTINHEPNTLSTIEVCGTIEIKHGDDVGQPDPIDVSVFTVNGQTVVVVIDGFINKSLKSIYALNQRKYVSRLRLSNTPLRLVKIPGNRIAATIKDSCCIVVAEVGPELVVLTKVTTKKQYTCLTSLLDSNLVVGSNSPPSIDIIDLTGYVLRSFTPHTTCLSLMQNPRYLCTTHKGRILVSDSSKSVYCLTSKGVVVFAFKSIANRVLVAPEGITVTNTGDILLAENFHEKVIQLTSDGFFVRDILTSKNGIKAPRGMCVDDANKLYVCKRVDDMSIQVFKIT